jgi:allophanate hydrolase
LPTTPTTYRIEDVERDPIELNRRLGYYTNFVNLLDLTGVAVPAGFRADGQPLGVTVLAPAFSDQALLELASRFHADEPSKVGATAIDVSTSPLSSPASAPIEVAPIEVAPIEVAVVGAHLQGEPLNHQLTSRGGTLVKACRTAKPYRLYALAGTVPPKPGLVFEANFDGPGIDIEVWALDVASFGSFVDEVGRPLAIGSLALDDGSTVKGFVCEPYAVVGATEITAFGGWRAYRRSLS